MSLFLIEPSSINYSDDITANETFATIYGVLSAINYSGALTFGITDGISDGTSVYKDEPYGRLTVSIATGA